MANQKKKILIVEDDSFVLDIYQTKLTQEGFEVATASNGLEVLRKIKKDEELKTIPVILLTNLSQKEEINEGMSLGASDYLIKSHFTPSEVLEKINIYLK